MKGNYIVYNGSLIISGSDYCLRNTVTLSRIKVNSITSYDVVLGFYGVSLMFDAGNTNTRLFQLSIFNKQITSF